MATKIVITGELRSPGLLLRIVDDAAILRRSGQCDQIVVSTWTTELARVPWLAESLRAQGVEMLASPPIALDTYRNYRRQQHLLDQALNGCADGDIVVKLRPDWVITREHLTALCAEPAPVAEIKGGPQIVRGKVRLPWWSTRVPFHVADECMAGFAEDLRNFNPVEARLALADPHAGRYLPHLEQYMPVLRFVDEHLLSYIADSQPDTAEVIEALGGPRQDPNERAINQQVGPHRFDVTSMALDLVSYQRALAAYIASIDLVFEVFNPTPMLDQFIERHGPWACTTPDVHTTGNPLRSPDPICYLPEKLARVASRIPQEFDAFHEAWREYRYQPLTLFALADEEQCQRDAKELHQRVRRYRQHRLGLTPSPGVPAPQSFRRLALDKDVGPRFSTLACIYEHAKAKLPEAAWAYLAGGASDEQTLRDNQAAFDRWSVLPAHLTGVVEVDTRTTFCDIELAAPILTAPIGCDLLFHPDGQRAIVRAAAGWNIAPVVSEASYWSLEAAAAESDGAKVMQLHACGDPDDFRALAERAQDAGFAAICVTVDCPALGWRERIKRIGFEVDEAHFSGNHLGSDGFARRLLSGKGSNWTWDTLANVVTELTVPVIVKGILTAEDADQAVEAGASAMIVSNHGGRQLDTVPATLDQLPSIVEAVGQRVAVGLDGGIRRGTDILKALALGADVVLIGRPVAMGLGAAGEAGARQVVELLINELRRSMLLAGCPSLGEIDRRLVQPRRSA